MRLIGDVHDFRQGNIQTYLNLIKGCDKSIQIGDLSLSDYHFLDDVDHSYHRFIPGNHDNYDLLPNKHSLMDFGIYEGIFYVRGGWTIDGPHGLWNGRRVQGIDYWETEEIPTAELYKAINLYCQIKPRIVVSHEAPLFVVEKMQEDKLLMRRFTQEILRVVKTRTSQALEAMFREHRPKHWYFGHYHRDVEYNIDGCQFRCLDELSYVDI